MIENSNYPYPTERIDLPSKGIIYPDNHILSKGYVDIKYMGAKEDDILTNSNYAQKGLVIEKLIQSVIATPGVKLDDMLLADQEKIMVAMRILGIGKNYTYNAFVGGKRKEITIDLTNFEDKPLDEKLFQKGINEFSYTDDKTKIHLTFKLLTGHDEKLIKLEREGRQKIDPNYEGTSELRLKQMITSVNGNRDKKDINNYVDNQMIRKQITEFFEYVNSITPGLNTRFKWLDEETGKEEDLILQLTIGFLWPNFAGQN